MPPTVHYSTETWLVLLRSERELDPVDPSYISGFGSALKTDVYVFVAIHCLVH